MFYRHSGRLGQWTFILLTPFQSAVASCSTSAARSGPFSIAHTGCFWAKLIARPCRVDRSLPNPSVDLGRFGSCAHRSFFFTEDSQIPCLGDWYSCFRLGVDCCAHARLRLLTGAPSGRRRIRIPGLLRGSSLWRHSSRHLLRRCRRQKPTRLVGHPEDLRPKRGVLPLLRTPEPRAEEPARVAMAAPAAHAVAAPRCGGTHSRPHVTAIRPTRSPLPACARGTTGHNLTAARAAAHVARTNAP